jgi:hypothetical protein
MKIRFLLQCLLLAFLLASPICHAQSTAETTEAIKSDLDSIKAEFVANLQSAISNPENLQSGQAKIGCEQILNKIDQLLFRINETIDLLAKRETDLAGKAGLGETEKLELKQALQLQRKPLDTAKQTALKLQTELRALVDQKLGAVLETYSSFREIAGPEKAQEKVESRLNEIIVPYLPPKPKSTPTPRPSPTSKPVQVGQREVPPTRPATSASVGGDSILSFSEAYQRAENGDAYAEAVVSIYYAVGYKTGKDIARAAEYALRSAQQQHPLGVYRLAAMVENGDGFERDPYRAKQLKAGTVDGLNSMSGDPYAMTALGVMLFRGEGGLPKNQKEAARLYKLAADMGYAPAQYNYAACLIAGQGVTKNRALGIRYWEKACAQQYSVALQGIPE